MSQDRQWFVSTLRRLGYTEAAEEAARTLPDPVSLEELKQFADRYNISRDEVMSQMGGSP
jgi:Tfp pilus assembly protein PilN